MERRPLGRTGPRVTPIGLGLAAVGRPGYIDLGREEDLGADRSVGTMGRRAHELLDVTYELGILYVDAARSYGRAEEFLASWLRSRGSAADVVVGSKWGYTYVGGWRVDAPVHEVKDHSLTAFRRQLAETRALLGERLALYQIHSATFETGVLEDRALLDALARVRDEGVVVGLTTSGADQAAVVRAALGIEVGGRRLFGSVQSTWNALERSVAPALAEAHEAGLGVIVKEAMANGRLARDGPRPLVAVAERHAAGVDALALALVLAQPWCDVVLSGAVTTDQVAANVLALDIELTEEDVAELDALVEPSETYWAERSALPWR
ncbi:MAG TPA: aldo/keto reductase [Actinomycetota bacterium]|nr:aldo/keto reductase [Actinomycetota bacterium]